jgi:hypothetical protein
MENQREYLDWVAQQLNLQRYEDWYEVESSQIIEMGGTTLLKVIRLRIMELQYIL